MQHNGKSEFMQCTSTRGCTVTHESVETDCQDALSARQSRVEYYDLKVKKSTIECIRVVRWCIWRRVRTGEEGEKGREQKHELGVYVSV